MSTHAAANKCWSEKQLNELQIESGFRLRGLEVTRLDTFVDAAFAFVLTLLVISFDAIPANYDELILAIKKIPAFFFSFLLIMQFWLSHRRWSRRYGLETPLAVLTSLALIFMLMVFIYPLRIIFESLFVWLSNGYFPGTFVVAGIGDLRGMFVFYSLGFGIMSMLMAILFALACKQAVVLGLNSEEKAATNQAMWIWANGLIISVISIIIALTIDDIWITLAGFIHILTPLASIISSRIIDRKIH